MKIIIMILIAISLTSCHEKGKFEFVKKFLENPDKIEDILKSSDFQSDYFINGYLKSELGRNNFIRWANKFKGVDSSEELKYETTYYNTKGTLADKITEYNIFCILVLNKERNFILRFEWKNKESDIWYLCEITPLDEYSVETMLKVWK